MKNSTKISIILLLLINFVSAKGQKSMIYSHHKLSNGMEVFLSENRESPVIYSEISVRAGSKNDPAHAEGIAHYLEHMLFKGSINIGTVDYSKEKPHLDRITELFDLHKAEKDPAKKKAYLAEISRESTLAAQYAIPNEFDSLYQGMGATKLNAHTSVEETVYKIEIPANCLEKWAMLESDRFSAPVFRLFQTELEAVYEEKNRAMDNAGRAIYQPFMDLVFKNHQYGQQTTLGSVEDLKNPSITEMYKFFRTYYVPNNMAIILSGDFKSAEVLPLLEQYFGKLKSRELPTFKAPQEKAFNGEERIDVNFPGEEALMMAFRTVPKGHKDEAALLMIDMLLDNNATGLININLTQKQKVLHAGNSPRFMNDHGIQMFYGSPLKGQSLEEVRDLILEQIDNIKNGQFDETTMHGIVNDFAVDFERRLEDNVARVGIMREAVTANIALKERLDLPKKLKAISKEEVIAVANKYFGKNYALACRLDKKREIAKMPKPNFEPIKINRGRTSNLAQKIKDLPIVEIAEKYLDFAEVTHSEIADGLELYSTKNPINSLFSLSIIIDKGSVHDRNLPHLKNYLSLLGTQNLTPTQFKKALYAEAITLNSSSSYRRTSFTIEGQQKNLATGLKLLIDLVENTKFDNEILQKYLESQLARRENNLKDPSALEKALNSYARLEKKSPYIEVLSNEQLQKLTISDMKKALDELLQSHVSIHYTGPQTNQEITKLLKEIIPSKKRLAKRQELFRQPAVIDKNDIFFLQQNQVQAKVRLFFPGVEFSQDIYNKADLYNEYFDGSLGSIVFQEIRESRALAYSAWARYFTSQHSKTKNTFMAALGTQADKSIEAIEVLKDIIFDMPRVETRFKTAKKALLRKSKTARVPFRERLNQVRTWQDQGFSQDPRKAKNQVIGDMTFEQLLQFHKSEIKNKNFRLVIIGDANKIDLEKLSSTIGPIRKVKAQELFAY